ncbi:polyribonucleotide nucleotidyltransferase, partial [Vibrio breoganii]
VNTELKARVAELAETRLSDAYQITEKMARYEQVGTIKTEAVAALLAQDENLDEREIRGMLGSLEKNVVRSRIIAGNPRIDGREKDMV